MAIINQIQVSVSFAFQALVRAWRWLLQSIVKVATKIHGALSALVLLFALSSESVLHALNIPHVEGLWLTLVGGGAVATSLALWLHKHKPRTDP